MGYGILRPPLMGPLYYVVDTHRCTLFNFNLGYDFSFLQGDLFGTVLADESTWVLGKVFSSKV